MSKAAGAGRAGVVVVGGRGAAVLEVGGGRYVVDVGFDRAEVVLDVVEEALERLADGGFVFFAEMRCLRMKAFGWRS